MWVSVSTFPLRSGTSFSVKLGLGGNDVVHTLASEGAMSLSMGFMCRGSQPGYLLEESASS